MNRKAWMSLALGCLSAASVSAQEPPYTYQAVLEANGAPASGLYSARFRLWDATTNGMPISPADVVTGPTPPDPFGRLNLIPRGDPWSFWRDLLCRVAQPWPPIAQGDWPTAWSPIFLEVGIKGPGETGFTTLSPRQELTPAPVAINAVLAGRADSLKLPFAASLSSTFPGMELTQMGDGPAARFKVQPQPEPPSPSPALEAISGISSPAIHATNTGSGPAAYLATSNATSSAAALSVESNGTSYAATIVNTGGGHGSYVTCANGTPGSFEITNPANGSPALHSETSGPGPAVFASNTGGGDGVYASSTTGNAIHGVSSMGTAGYFEGNVHLTGDLTKAYTSGTSDLATPIAYGNIAAGGSVNSATPNVSSAWDAANSRYLITIAGESYLTSGYVTTASPVDGPGAPRFATTSSTSGQLIVRVYDLAGTSVQNSFQFITYKP